MNPRLPTCLLAVVLGCSAQPPAAPDTRPDLRTRQTGDDWPRFLGPHGDSTSSETGIRTDWTGGLRRVWQVPLGEGFAAPTISRGRLFHFDRFGDKARLTCRKSETGEQLWQYEHPTDYVDQYGYNGGPRCCPVVDEDRVYLHGVEGMLCCVRATDGKLLWQVNTVAEFGVVQNFFGVGSTPIVEGNLLIVHIGGSPPGSGSSPTPRQKGNGSGLVAFDKLTGKVVWKATDELASYASPVVAMIHGRRLGLQFARDGLIGFEPATGKMEFRYPWRARYLESVNASNPVVVGDTVLITECYELGSALLRLPPRGAPEVVWSDADKRRSEKSLTCHWNTPIHVGGFVYGSSGRHTEEAELRCVELQTGRVAWRRPGLTRCSLLAVDGHFVCLGEDGTLRLLKQNPKAYEEVAREEMEGLDYPCWAAPVLSHGLLHVRGRDRLVCLELIPERAPSKPGP